MLLNWYVLTVNSDTPNHHLCTQIKRYSWNLRGEIKSFARHFVPGAYGFKQVLSTDAEGIQRNVELARELLEKNTFKYQVHIPVHA